MAGSVSVTEKLNSLEAGKEINLRNIGYYLNGVCIWRIDNKCQFRICYTNIEVGGTVLVVHKKGG